MSDWTIQYPILVFIFSLWNCPKNKCILTPFLKKICFRRNFKLFCVLSAFISYVGSGATSVSSTESVSSFSKSKTKSNSKSRALSIVSEDDGEGEQLQVQSMIVTPKRNDTLNDMFSFTDQLNGTTNTKVNWAGTKDDPYVYSQNKNGSDTNNIVGVVNGYDSDDISSARQLSLDNSYGNSHQTRQGRRKSHTISGLRETMNAAQLARNALSNISGYTDVSSNSISPSPARNAIRCSGIQLYLSFWKQFSIRVVYKNETVFKTWQRNWVIDFVGAN